MYWIPYCKNIIIDTVVLSYSSSWSIQEGKEFDKIRSVSWSGQVSLYNSHIFKALFYLVLLMWFCFTGFRGIRKS